MLVLQYTLSSFSWTSDSFLRLKQLNSMSKIIFEIQGVCQNCHGAFFFLLFLFFCFTDAFPVQLKSYLKLIGEKKKKKICLCWNKAQGCRSKIWRMVVLIYQNLLNTVKVRMHKSSVEHLLNAIFWNSCRF